MFTYQAISNKSNASAACLDLYEQLHTTNTDIILFFCSSLFDLDVVAQQMQTLFLDKTCLGCTTAGEFAGNGYETQTIVAVGFNPNYFSFSYSYVEDIQNFSLIDAQKVMQYLHADMKKKAMAPIATQSFIVSLVDGLSSAEEEFLVNFDTATQNFPHFGGSAGDDQGLNQTYIYYDGQFKTSSAVIIMFNTSLKFSVFSTHHVLASVQKLIVTDADPKTRQVFEINGEPAAEVYANTLGMNVEQLEPEVFSIHPLAVKVRGEYYIRSIQRVNKDFNSLSFYCAVDVGIVLNEVQLTDINTPLRELLEYKQNGLGSPAMVLGFDCFLRRLEVTEKKLEKDTRQLQKDFNLIGFNAYGEHLNGVHLNQTFTGVFISKELHND